MNSIMPPCGARRGLDDPSRLDRRLGVDLAESACPMTTVAVADRQARPGRRLSVRTRLRAAWGRARGWPGAPSRQVFVKGRHNGIYQAMHPDFYAPMPGDILHYGRLGAEKFDFAEAQSVYWMDSFYPSHSDIVVKIDQSGSVLHTIDGNVTNSRWSGECSDRYQWLSLAVGGGWPKLSLDRDPAFDGFKHGHLESILHAATATSRSRLAKASPFRSFRRLSEGRRGLF